jgi:hypothetical protein
MGTSGGPGKVDNLQQIDQLAQIAMSFLQRSKTLFKTAKPLFQESAAQQLEALKTGGVGARIPMIQRAVEASKAATAGALRGTTDELAATGLAGTPFAASTLAGTRMSGEQATSQIPTTIAQHVISSPTSGLDMIRAALDFGTAGAGAEHGSAALDLSRQTFNAEQFASFMKDLKQSVQSAAMSGAGG